MLNQLLDVRFQETESILIHRFFFCQILATLVMEIGIIFLLSREAIVVKTAFEDILDTTQVLSVICVMGGALIFLTHYVNKFFYGLFLVILVIVGYFKLPYYLTHPTEIVLTVGLFIPLFVFMYMVVMRVMGFVLLHRPNKKDPAVSTELVWNCYVPVFFQTFVVFMGNGYLFAAIYY